MVEHDRSSGLFSLGHGLIELARPAGLEALLRSAQPVLARLALQTGETAALAVITSEGLVYVDEAVPSAIVSATWRTRRVPVHATSTGKALLAFSSRSAVAWMIESPLTAYTTTTITDPEELEEELTRTRTRGYGVCRGEYEATAFGVSAPVLNAAGEPVAVVSIWGPEGRVGDERFEALGRLALEAARSLGV
jgi:DNA-binding IclR family transcriptional regulator